MYHTVPLDVGKNQVGKALDLEMLDKAKLDKQIENFPWTGEFKDGGSLDNSEKIPKVLVTGKLKVSINTPFQWPNVSWKVRLTITGNMKLYPLCQG